MSKAAEYAAQILVHYLRHAAKGTDLGNPDTFAEIEGAMQDVIDEAVKRAVADVQKVDPTKLPPGWKYMPPTSSFVRGERPGEEDEDGASR
jgi:hypothetical protein